MSHAAVICKWQLYVVVAIGPPLFEEVLQLLVRLANPQKIVEEPDYIATSNSSTSTRSITTTTGNSTTPTTAEAVAVVAAVFQ